MWRADLEFDQRNNRLGAPGFRHRPYCTMLIGEAADTHAEPE